MMAWMFYLDIPCHENEYTKDEISISKIQTHYIHRTYCAYKKYANLFDDSRLSFFFFGSVVGVFFYILHRFINYHL